MLVERLRDQYFGAEGIEYTIARVPIASSDFSTNAYSYLTDDQDFQLSNFQLTEFEDRWKVVLYDFNQQS